MKRINLIFLFIVIECFAGIRLYAYDAVIDGIYYNFSGTNATVTYKESGFYDVFSDYSGNIVIPEYVTYESTTYKVTSIGSRAFANCENLISVTIPNSVTSIGSSAFQNCSLQSIVIGNGLISIGSDAFYFCLNLTKVIIPDISGWCESSITYEEYNSNPLSIAGHIFSDENTEITNLVIPDGTTSIGDNAFNDCSSLTSVTIPNSVTSIGSSAFSGCSGLASITIPNSVTSIGSSAFSGCSGLTSVTIPNSVTSIGEYNQEIKGETNVEIIPVIA